jgi:hypothetical protein
MTKIPSVGRFGVLSALPISLALSLALSSCDLVKPPAPVDAKDWRDEVIYFAMTDRFANGSASNDLGPARNAGDTADKTNPSRAITGTGPKTFSRPTRISAR